MSAFSTSCIVLSAMDGQTEQLVCSKLCKSAAETLEMIREVFGGHSSSRTAQLQMNVQGCQAQAKRQKMLKKFQNSSTRTVAEQSTSSQTQLGSAMEFVGDLNRKCEQAPRCREVCSPALGVLTCLELRERANKGPTFVSRIQN
jgi:hypothetical protein